jgi:hypothetical protein
MTISRTLIPAVIIGLIVVGAMWLYGEQRQQRAPLSSSVQPQSSTSAQALALQAARATSTATVATPIASPIFITVNTSTLVTITVQALDATLIPDSINLLRLGAAGTQPTILGVMHDDGLNGDAVAGDHIYTLQKVFSEATVGQIQLQVSAAFHRQLRRVASQILEFPVWGVLTDPTSRFMAPYPPGLYNLSNSSTPTSFSLESSPGGVAIGGVAPEDGSNATTSGFSIIIQVSPYNTSFDINTWLATAAPYSEIDTLATTTIAGVSAYVITFKNQVGAGRPTAVVYHQGSVYQISYASTFAPGSVADQNGVNAFNSILQNFTFF